MERRFNDYSNLLKLKIKNKVAGIKPKYESRNQAAFITDHTGGETRKSLGESVANARYFACLIDGSTDNSVIEQEVVYGLFFDSDVPVTKYVSIETAENANAERLQKSIEGAFGGFVKK